MSFARTAIQLVTVALCQSCASSRSRPASASCTLLLSSLTAFPSPSLEVSTSAFFASLTISRNGVIVLLPVMAGMKDSDVDSKRVFGTSEDDEDMGVKYGETFPREATPSAAWTPIATERNAGLALASAGSDEDETGGAPSSTRGVASDSLTCGDSIVDSSPAPDEHQFVDDCVSNFHQRCVNRRKSTTGYTSVLQTYGCILSGVHGRDAQYVHRASSYFDICSRYLVVTYSTFTTPMSEDGNLMWDNSTRSKGSRASDLYAILHNLHDVPDPSPRSLSKSSTVVAFL